MVVNEREVTLRDLSVTVASTGFEIESLPPGDSISWRWVAESDGQYVIRFRVGTTEVVDSMGYVTGGMRTEDVIRVQNDSLVFELRPR